MAVRPVPEPPHGPGLYLEKPEFITEAKLWLYGNVGLLGASLACIPAAFGRAEHSPSQRDRLEAECEKLVLAGQVVVAGIHNAAHQRVAVVPLRWGAPRILVVSGGFHYHLGPHLRDEPFRVARLWRYQFDPQTDLVISRRAPDRLPTYSRSNPTVDRLIQRVVDRTVPGL